MSGQQQQINVGELSDEELQILQDEVIRVTNERTTLEEANKNREIHRAVGFGIGACLPGRSDGIGAVDDRKRGD